VESLYCGNKVVREPTGFPNKPNIYADFNYTRSERSTAGNYLISRLSIDGTKTFTQYLNIRQTPRKKGAISITEYFRQWEKSGLVPGNMYEAKFLAEAGG
jgi:hypothetical protein